MCILVGARASLRLIKDCLGAGRMLLCLRDRSVGDLQTQESLQRQFSHGHSHDHERDSSSSSAGASTRISQFLPTSRRIVQFSNGKVCLLYFL
jgi:ethanolamine-phosphate cytidylyltransferase